MGMAGARRSDENVLLFHEFGQRRIASETRMIFLENAHVAAGKELLPADPRNEKWKFPDGQIDLTRVQ